MIFIDLKYKDKLISISKVLIRDLKIGELRALTMSEKVISSWIRGSEIGMEDKELREELKSLVEKFYLKYPEHKVTLALNKILDILVLEEQKRINGSK